MVSAPASGAKMVRQTWWRVGFLQLHFFATKVSPKKIDMTCITILLEFWFVYPFRWILYNIYNAAKLILGIFGWPWGSLRMAIALWMGKADRPGIWRVSLAGDPQVSMVVWIQSHGHPWLGWFGVPKAKKGGPHMSTFCELFPNHSAKMRPRNDLIKYDGSYGELYPKCP